MCPKNASEMQYSKIIKKKFKNVAKKNLYEVHLQKNIKVGDYSISISIHTEE